MEVRQFRGIPMASTLLRAEPIGSITAATTNTKYNLPTQNGNLPMDRFIHSLFIEVAMRYTAGAPGAPAGPVNVDAPFSVINRVVVSGYHRIRGQQETIVDLRGPDLAELVRIYQSNGLYSIPAGVLGIGAGATNDIRFVLPVPFVPLFMPRYLQTAYLLDAPNYDQLRLDIYWADETNLVTPGVNAGAFSAFGLAGGSPVINVSGLFAQAGASQFKGFVPGRVWRYFSELTGAAMTTTATGTRLFNVPRGNRLRGVLLKTGVKAVTTAGNDAFATLGGGIVANWQVMRGINKVIRRYNDNFVGEAEQSYTKGILPTGGYLLIDWCQQGILDSAFDLRGLTAGPSGDVDTYIQGDVTGVAAQAAVAIWEELRGYPQNF